MRILAIHLHKALVFFNHETMRSEDQSEQNKKSQSVLKVNPNLTKLQFQSETYLKSVSITI